MEVTCLEDTVPLDSALNLYSFPFIKELMPMLKDETFSISSSFFFDC